MRRVVLVLVAAALTAGACWLLCDRNGLAPPDGLGPGIGEHPSATSPGTGPETASGGTGDAPPPRTTGAQIAASTRLEVVVVRDADERPLAEVEVLAMAADVGFRTVAATDRAGLAAFAVPATEADGNLPIAIDLCVGGSRMRQVLLAPGTPRRVILRLRPTLFVQGHVVDRDGRDVPGAELLFLARAGQLWREPHALQIGRADADGRFRIALFGSGHLGARHAAFAPSAMVDIAATPRDPATGVAIVRLQLDAPRCRMKGIVLHRDGAPARGVDVALFPTGTQASDLQLAGPPVRLRSDSNGQFTTAELPPGTIRYQARAIDGSCARGEFATHSGRPAGVRIELNAGATVSGRVRSADGQGVAAIVQAGTPGDFWWQQVECESDGSYALEGLPTGQSELVARDAARIDASVARRRATKVFDLSAGETATWDPVLEAPAGGRRLRGLVIDAHQRPLAGCAVLAHQHDPSRDVQIETDATGRFEIPCEGSGRFDVFVYAPGRSYTGFPCVGRRSVDADDGQLLLEIDTARQPATLHGRLRSPDDVEVPAAAYCWHREHNQTVRFAAAPDGTFRLQDIPPGTVMLFFRHPGFVAPRLEVELQSGEVRDLGTITLERGAAVRGQVIAASGSEPVDLEISIQTDSGPLLAEYADGSYRFDSVPAGKHRLLIRGTEIAASAHAIEVTAGVDLQQDIRVEPGIARRIRVSDPLGNGGWVTVALREPDQPYTCMIGQPLPASGAVEFVACMATGTYEAVAWSEQGRQGRATMTFTPGAAATTVIELQDD